MSFQAETRPRARLLMAPPGRTAMRRDMVQRPTTGPSSVPLSMAALALLTMSSLVRAFSGSAALLFLTTVGIGAGLAIAGVLTASFVKGNFPSGTFRPALWLIVAVSVAMLLVTPFLQPRRHHDTAGARA